MSKKRKGRSKAGTGKGKGRGKGKGKSKGKRGKGKAKPASNEIPLDILERRLGKLNRTVLKRGGNGYQ